MIFLDTSAIYALADEGDANHGDAVNLFSAALGNAEELLVHNYILVESAFLLQRRLGLSSALQLLNDAQGFRVHWIREEDHDNAVALLTQRGRRALSLVDCMSFVVMRDYGVEESLGFDSDFEREGFTAYAGLGNSPDDAEV